MRFISTWGCATRGSLGNDDMRMNVDGRSGGAAGQAVGVMDAGGGAAVAVFAFDHLMSLSLY